jgi:Flp pilus assembly pilin Flp
VSATILAGYRLLCRFKSGEAGQGLVEYLLILSLVSVVAILALSSLGTTIVTKLYGLSNSL